MDIRLALPYHTILHLVGMDCTIENEIGRGSNAIVYQASYPDTITKESRHHVLIKELFPRHKKGKIYRMDDGLTVHSEDDDFFEMHRKSFECANQVHLSIREKFPGEFGVNINACEANGTLYAIIDFNGGRTLESDLRQHEKLTLRTIVKRMIGITESLSYFHSLGLLHLDISPDNILLISSGSRERIELIDYNSVVDINNKEGMIISLKTGYASPEIRSHNIAAIGYASDLYAVTAVFFYCLMGRRLEKNEYRGMRRPSVRYSPYLQNVPQTVSGFTMEMIRKGLCASRNKRYQSCDQLLKDLYELLDRIDGIGITHAALWEVSRREIQKAVNSNPSLNYICDDSKLYPVQIENPDHHTVSEFSRGDCGNIVLMGNGGTGKTTFFMRTVWQETKIYRKANPVFFYLSLYHYVEGEYHFIHNSILSKMRFKSETATFENARHALDLLLRKPIRSGLDEYPVLCLYLDGFNEIVGDTRGLIQEIEELAALDGVRIMIASRSQPEGIVFDHWQMMPLKKHDIQNILGENGLLVPKSDEMVELLTNPMMLNLFISASLNQEQQLIINSKEELVRIYLDALLKKEQLNFPENDPQRWQIEAAVQCVYPLIAFCETNRKKAITVDFLFSEITRLYHTFKEKIFLKDYPCFLGHTADVYGGAEDADQWFGKMLDDILWHRMGLLIRNDEGFYRIAHQEFRDILSPDGSRIRKTIQKIQKRNRFFAVFKSGTHFSAEAPSYDASKAVDALSYVQIIYEDINRQMTDLQSIISRDIFENAPSEDLFEEIRKRFQIKSMALLSMDSNQNGRISDNCMDVIRSKLKNGERFSWNDLAFDELNTQKMADLSDTLRDEIDGYICVLEKIYKSGRETDYIHCSELISHLMSKEAKLAAAYNYIVFSRRLEGLSQWESSKDGKKIEGSYQRLDKGRQYCTLLEKEVMEEWTSYDLNELLSVIEDAYNEALEAKRDLAQDKIYITYKMMTYGGSI